MKKYFVSVLSLTLGIFFSGVVSAQENKCSQENLSKSLARALKILDEKNVTNKEHQIEQAKSFLIRLLSDCSELSPNDFAKGRTEGTSFAAEQTCRLPTKKLYPSDPFYDHLQTDTILTDTNGKILAGPESYIATGVLKELRKLVQDGTCKNLSRGNRCSFKKERGYEVRDIYINDVSVGAKFSDADAGRW